MKYQKATWSWLFFLKKDKYTKMKILYALIFFAFVLISSCAVKPLPSSAAGMVNKDITILCYNIHHANPPSKPGLIDIEAIANVIRQQNPDLVALQEVDVNTSRSGTSLNQAEELGRLTGMTAYFGKAIDYGGGEYGVAILSKLPLTEIKNRSLPSAAGTNGEPRTLLSATITLPGNNQFIFASTHLDAQRNDANRQLQIKKILELVKQETLPVIIAGDFNAVPESDVVKQMDNYFTRTCLTGCPFTIPVINPNKTIDYIAYAPENAFTVVAHEVINEQYASDHLPVKAIFKLK